jgi:diguanylate cyclase (GGDEF)-like protein
MKEQASRDPLTGLYNRRALDEHLTRIIDRRTAEGGTLSLLMIDVDYFKLLNDTLGHAAGDQLLRSIGQIIRSGIRESDLAFRCGGDEFVVVLDPCEPRDACRLVDRLVSLVDALAKPLRVSRPPRLSIGLSHLGDFGQPSAKALLEAADRALYNVKGDRKRRAG